MEGSLCGGGRRGLVLEHKDRPAEGEMQTSSQPQGTELGTFEKLLPEESKGRSCTCSRRPTQVSASFSLRETLGSDARPDVVTAQRVREAVLMLGGSGQAGILSHCPAPRLTPVLECGSAPVYPRACHYRCLLQ